MSSQFPPDSNITLQSHTNTPLLQIHGWFLRNPGITAPLKNFLYYTRIYRILKYYCCHNFLTAFCFCLFNLYYDLVRQCHCVSLFYMESRDKKAVTTCSENTSLEFRVVLFACQEQLLPKALYGT